MLPGFVRSFLALQDSFLFLGSSSGFTRTSHRQDEKICERKIEWCILSKTEIEGVKKL